MAAVRHSLQKEVFASSGERLLVYCEVAKLLKKKKTCYVCLTSSAEPPATASVSCVKRIDRNSFKKKQSWLLSEIKSLDGGTDVSSRELELVADKPYRWVALSEHDRQQFVTALAQLAQHSGDNIEFRHFPDAWIGPQAAHSPDSPLILPASSDADAEELASLGELDSEELAALLGGADAAVDDAELFVRRLADRLAALDCQNLQGMLASEAQVEALMDKLEQAMAYAESLDTRLERYDELLRHIRDTMDKMEEKNGNMETANRNGRALLHELAAVVSWLDTSALAFGEASLATAEGRAAALVSAEAMRSALNAKKPPYLYRLAAVQEQLRKITKYKEKFSAGVSRHLNNLLIHLGNDATQEHVSTGLVWTPRSKIHAELEPYAPLMHWMKQMEEKTYVALTKVYTGAMVKLYERDSRSLLESARAAVSAAGAGAAAGGSAKEKKGRSNDSREDLTGNDAAAKQFDSVLETVLSQVEAVCNSEQEFCVMFFQLEYPNKLPQSMESSIEGSVGSGGGGGGEENVRRGARDTDTRRIMADLFPTLERDLVTLIAHYEKLDQYGSMRALARLGTHVLGSPEAEVGGEGEGEARWVRGALAACAIAAKRGADRSVADRLKAMPEAAKVTSRRTKCAILPYVVEFEEFCTTAERIFGRAGRRADVERWYGTMLAGMLQAISAHDHPRTPHTVIKMENFHHLYDVVSQLRLPALDALRKELKARYSDALRAYVTQYFGRPLEKLNQFFEGVSECVAGGVREEEVSYQAAFSKHELRRILALYPHREVRRSLHALYKKVEKHLCEEENLLQVVWRAMQEEFIAQYKYLESRIQTCYPGSLIALDFSIEDILESFSDIARSH